MPRVNMGGTLSANVTCCTAYQQRGPMIRWSGTKSRKGRKFNLWYGRKVPASDAKASHNYGIHVATRLPDLNFTDGPIQFLTGGLAVSLVVTQSSMESCQRNFFLCLSLVSDFTPANSSDVVAFASLWPVQRKTRMQKESAKR